MKNKRAVIAKTIRDLAKDQYPEKKLIFPNLVFAPESGSGYTDDEDEDSKSSPVQPSLALEDEMEDLEKDIPQQEVRTATKISLTQSSLAENSVAKTISVTPTKPKLICIPSTNKGTQLVAVSAAGQPSTGMVIVKKAITSNLVVGDSAPKTVQVVVPRLTAAVPHVKSESPPPPVPSVGAEEEIDMEEEKKMDSAQTSPDSTSQTPASKETATVTNTEAPVSEETQDPSVDSSESGKKRALEVEGKPDGGGDAASPKRQRTDECDN